MIDFQAFEQRVCDLLGYSVKKGIAQTGRGLANYTSYIKKDKGNELQISIHNDPYCTMQIVYDAEVYKPSNDRLFLISVCTNGTIILQENLTDGTITYHCDGVKRLSTIENKLKQLLKR